jgi:hypothetical protein
MKTCIAALCTLTIATSLMTATIWESDRTRLHLTGVFSGKDFFADLIMTSSEASLKASLLAGGWEASLDGRLLDQTIEFTSSNQTIFPGKIVAPIPQNASSQLAAVWVSQNRRTTLTAKILAREIIYRAEKEKLYDTSCAWPLMLGYNRQANAIITTSLSNYVLSNQATFLKDASEPDAIDSQRQVWAYHTAYQVRMASDRIFSLRLETYSYSGGAHPNRWTLAWNFVISGSSARRLTLANITRQESMDLLLHQVHHRLTEKGASWPDQVELSHLENFVFTPEGVEFLFDPYTAGSYAEGEYTVALTWAEMERFLLPGVR